MARAQRPHDRVERIRKPGRKRREAPLAHEKEQSERPRDRRAEPGAGRQGRIVAQDEHRGEHRDAEPADQDGGAPGADLEAGLDEEAVEPGERQKTLAVGRQPALAAQLHQDLLAVAPPSVGDLEASVDPAAVVLAVVEEKEERLGGEHRGERREDVEDVEGVDLEAHGNGLRAPSKGRNRSPGCSPRPRRARAGTADARRSPHDGRGRSRPGPWRCGPT